LPTTALTIDGKQLRVQFLDYLFGENKGYICVATANLAKANFQQKFFEWPTQRPNISEYIENVYLDSHVWFGVCLLSQPERRKEFCLPSSFAWADLDLVAPDSTAFVGFGGVVPAPTAVVESSPNRYQAFWRISGEPIPPDVAEDYSRRIAYASDADKTGWDMVQLLRVPWTYNLKYDPVEPVRLLRVDDATLSVEEFEAIEPPINFNASDGIVDTVEPMPDLENLANVDNILYHFKAEGKLDEEFGNLFIREPESTADWSRLLWRFIHKCFDMGMDGEEVFAVSLQAACNKYKRDNRPIQYLWRDVIKAKKEHDNVAALIGSSYEVLKMPHLVDFDEFQEDSFIKDYKDWANAATDAPEQYHELTCFITLSAIICSGLYLAVEWGEIVPNLWGLVLGESTLTRKTTAMRLAVDMLKDIDDELILATDGSAEGLLTGLSQRPKRVSIFWKDEVSGLFDSINRKDYLAGLPETLTQLYDVPKVLTRLLRKETIAIAEPYFIFFGGGIRDKVYNLINEEYILSGFLPRFLIVSGENDLTRLRRTGPPTELGTERKDKIVRTLTDLRDRYNSKHTEYMAGQPVILNTRIEARLSAEAWAFAGDIEDKLTNVGADSDLSMVALPAFTRMYFNMLKMSLLVAASRRLPTSANILQVELSDVKQAAFYVQKWGPYTIDLIMNAGKTNTEKLISRALSLIKRKDGITRAEFMQRLHLSARDVKELIDTLDQRGLVSVKKAGRGIRLHAN
jgi:hypothetical protein